MKLWDRIRHTGRRKAGADVLAELADDAALPLVPDQHYFRVLLAQMHLADRSTLLSHWLPGAHVDVSYTRQDAAPVRYSKVMRPDLRHLAEGARINYPITDLVPYRGGVVEIDAVLFGLRTGTRLDLAVDVLQAVSGLQLPAVGPAVAVASQVSAAARALVDSGDGVAHLTVHQSYLAGGAVNAGNTLRPLYLAALQHSDATPAPAALRVVNDRLHTTAAGAPQPLLGVDFLLLRIEARPDRDDFWLPDLELFLSKAIAARRNGNHTAAEAYRQDAIAAAWDSPTLTWVDRDRVVAAVKARFAAVADAGLGVTGRTEPRSLRELVETYGPSTDLVLARGPTHRSAADGR